MAATKRADFCSGCPVGGRFNEPDQTCSEVDPADGLPVACVGEWVEEKHSRLRKYVDISRGPRRKFLANGGATYIDLYCGPGRARIRHTTRIVDGGVVVAAREAVQSGTPFTMVHAADINPDFVAAAEQRLRACGVAVHAVVGPASDAVGEIANALSPYGLHFTFLDPYDLRSLPFTVIHRLAAVQRMDLLIHVSVQDLQRNFRRYVDMPDSPLDSFAPGWRSRIAKMAKDIDLRRGVFDYWLDLIRDERLKPAQGVELVTGSKNQNLYWLVFAARHDLALKFWDEIRNVGLQRGLGF